MIGMFISLIKLFTLMAFDFLFSISFSAYSSICVSFPPIFLRVRIQRLMPLFSFHMDCLTMTHLYAFMPRCGSNLLQSSGLAIMLKMTGPGSRGGDAQTHRNETEPLVVWYAGVLWFICETAFHHFCNNTILILSRTLNQRCKKNDLNAQNDFYHPSPPKLSSGCQSVFSKGAKMVAVIEINMYEHYSTNPCRQVVPQIIFEMKAM